MAPRGSKDCGGSEGGSGVARGGGGGGLSAPFASNRSARILTKSRATVRSA